MNPAELLRVAVVTPYCGEPLETLLHCHESVRGQSYPCTHFLVADGHPRAEVSGWAAEHVILPKAHKDVGNTPRAVGSLSAMNQGYDAVAYLDADNWYYPGHVEAMVNLCQRTGAAVCTAGRSIHRLDGSLMYVDAHESDGQKHVDTSCLFLTRAAFRVLPVWAMMPPQLAPAGDTNLCRYVENSPTSGTDPSGLDVAMLYGALSWLAIGPPPPPCPGEPDWMKEGRDHYGSVDPCFGPLDALAGIAAEVPQAVWNLGWGVVEGIADWLGEEPWPPDPPVDPGVHHLPPPEPLEPRIPPGQPLW